MAGDEVATAVASVRASIREACARSGRDPDGVRLVAVSKTVPISRVRRAAAAGVSDFGENRATELAAKSVRLPATWHFLGKLQTGTVRHVADHAGFVHSAEPGAALERLGGRAARAGREIACLAQVDFTGRRQGVEEDDLPAFLSWAGGLPGIDVVGLMTLPPPSERPEGARRWFARLREIRDGLSVSFEGLHELSMGMSADFEIAVEEGATMVRVGTAVFGVRATARAGRGGPAGAVSPP